MEKVLKRGYVKWTDEAGVMHKEIATDFPEILKNASDKQKLAVEEAVELSGTSEEVVETTFEEETLEEAYGHNEDND